MSEKDTETNTPAVQYQVVAAGGSAQIIAFPLQQAGIHPAKAEQAMKKTAEAD